MSELFRAASNVARDAVGRVLCAAGGVNRASNDLNGKLVPLYKGGAQDRFRERVSDSLDRFCPRPPGALPPPSAPPFSGGQCPTNYTALLEQTRNNVTDPPFPTFISGPVVGIRKTLTNGGGVTRFELVGRGGDQVRFIASGPTDSTDVKLLSVSRDDGQPDDCGNPPDEKPPGQPDPTNPRPPDVDIDIDLPDVGPTTIVFSPTVGIIYNDVDADIRVPVNIKITGADVDIDFDVDFDVNISNPDEAPRPILPRPDTDDDDRPVLPDCPLPPDCEEEPEVGPPEDEDSDEDEEKGRVVTGFVILSVRNGAPIRQTELPLSGGQLLYVPYLGLANVVYETPDGNLAYSVDIPIKTTRQAVAVPINGLKAVRAVCRWELGWGGEVLVIRRPSCECNN